ncbi:MAG: arsenical pump-driving ATPase [Acidobacteria bacterium SCN 69-37]|nr:MAG: arsenical pump-driving ATPase [Acidobacteria bacterium SCN 69-37]
MALPFLPTRVMFFTGKGGVGKTSLACATAVALADSGQRVLLVSTDPASNLDEVLETRLSTRPTEVTGVPGLSALNINPDVAAHEYRERVVGPYRAMLPASAVASIEEQLSGACTVEIAAFDEFTTLLADADRTAAFDHVIFDTAPTGHTLRLLKLPAAWTGFIDTNTTGTSCLGPLAGLQGRIEVYRASLAALANADVTTIVLVTRPDTSALAEAARTSTELADLGITHQRLIVNGVFEAVDRDDPVARALEACGVEALAALPESLGVLQRTNVPLLPWAPLGVVGLRGVFARTPDRPTLEPATSRRAMELPAPLSALVDDIERDGHGVVMTMGKGGVGKTTTAAAIAIDLASRGHDVLLSTTDPAAHIASAINAAVPGLRVSRIDPAAETAAYAAEVIASASSDLDARGRELLEEDLRSPCTEEIAVFRAFARTVDEGSHGFVVLDTAPTGHTLLLLDAAEAYHREVSRTQGAVPDAVRQLLPRLRDAIFTKVLIVTLPEATPVHEAAQLQDDLQRAGVIPFAWVINQSFAGEAIIDPVLHERGARENQFLAEVQNGLAPRVAWVPWFPEAPVGRDRLLVFSRGTGHLATP